MGFLARCLFCVVIIVNNSTFCWCAILLLETFFTNVSHMFIENTRNAPFEALIGKEVRKLSTYSSCVALSYNCFFFICCLFYLCFAVLSSSSDCVFILSINLWIIIYYDLSPSNLFLSLYLECP